MLPPQREQLVRAILPERGQQGAHVLPSRNEVLAHRAAQRLLGQIGALLGCGQALLRLAEKRTAREEVEAAALCSERCAHLSPELPGPLSEFARQFRRVRRDQLRRCARRGRAQIRGEVRDREINLVPHR